MDGLILWEDNRNNAPSPKITADNKQKNYKFTTAAAILFGISVLLLKLSYDKMTIIVILQVGVTYNVDKAPEDNSFNFLLEVIRETEYEIEVKACSQWTVKNQNSGMAVMDVGIPSGFELDWDIVDKVRSS